MRRGVLAALAVMALVAVACGPDTRPAGETPPGSPALEALLAGEERLYRGILAMGLDVRAFTPCGEPMAAWVEDATGGELRDLYAQLAGIPNEPLYAELLGVVTDPPPEGPGSRYPYGFTVTGIRQISHVPQAPDCPDVEYGIVARGNEPFWRVRIAADGVEMLSPDWQGPLVFPEASERFSEGARIFATRGGDGRTLEVEIRDELCHDSMSGEVFPYQAIRRWEGRSDPGCATGEG